MDWLEAKVPFVYFCPLRWSSFLAVKLVTCVVLVYNDTNVRLSSSYCFTMKHILLSVIYFIDAHRHIQECFTFTMAATFMGGNRNVRRNQVHTISKHFKQSWQLLEMSFHGWFTLISKLSVGIRLIANSLIYARIGALKQGNGRLFWWMADFRNCLFSVAIPNRKSQGWLRKVLSLRDILILTHSSWQYDSAAAGRVVPEHFYQHPNYLQIKLIIGIPLT